MLANALFYVALIALAASTCLSAGLAMTRITMTRMAQHALAAGYQRASASLQQTLAADIASGVSPEAVPSFTPLPPACAVVETPCRYTTRASIALTQMGTQAASSACDPSATNCAVNEEANAYVNERRVPARITVTVSGPSGEVLAVRSSDVIVRTFTSAPYAAIAGARDGSFDTVTREDRAGDDGGTLPATPDPCGSSAAQDNTAVRVAYVNSATNACSDGSSWRDGSYDSQSANAGSWSP